MTAPPLLEARSLGLSFGVSHGLANGWWRRASALQVHAVVDASLQLQGGQALGLVGESGSGKTTLARLLVGLYEPTQGQVLWQGRPLADMTAHERRQALRHVQMVFQDPNASLNPRKTVAQIVGQPRVWQGLSSDGAGDAPVRRVLDLVGLPATVMSRYPHEFSGGQRQRISLARALVLQPQVLVLDEPLAALDVSVQAQILNLLGDLRRDLGLTLLFVSHDLAAVQWLCDRVAVMHLGRLVEQGAVRDVFAQSSHPYTRRLLDATLSGDPRLRKPTRTVLEDLCQSH